MPLEEIVNGTVFESTILAERVPKGIVLTALTPEGS
jgi:hypothetical protein